MATLWACCAQKALINCNLNTLMKVNKSKDPRRIDLPGRVVVAHQAEAIPWLGFFSKAAMGDVFLLLDDTQFKKEYFENRNKIRTPNKVWDWLNFPTNGKKHLPNMLEVELQGSNWKRKHLNKLRMSYGKAPYFSTIYPEIEELYASFSSSKLVDINIAFIKYGFKKFNINIPIYRISDLKKDGLKIEGESSELVLSIAKESRAKVFVAGQSGKNYLHSEAFTNSGIKLVFQEFEHPVYPQFHTGFQPYMSFLDLLFNCGNNALKYLPKSNYTF